MSRATNGSDEEKLEAFDRQKINVCGRLIDFKLIRAVSPVTKRDKDHLEIVIDKAASEAFCKNYADLCELLHMQPTGEPYYWAAGGLRVATFQSDTQAYGELGRIRDVADANSHKVRYEYNALSNFNWTTPIPGKYSRGK